jgi:hypothetical protein
MSPTDVRAPGTRWKDHGWYAHPPWFTVHHLTVGGDREAAIAAEEQWLDAIVQEAKQWDDLAAIKGLLEEAWDERRSIERHLGSWEIALAETNQKIEGYANRIRALGGEV